MTLKKFNVEEIANLFPFWGHGTIKQYVYRGFIPTRKISGRRFYDEQEIKEISEKLFNGEIAITKEGVVNGTAN